MVVVKDINHGIDIYFKILLRCHHATLGLTTGNTAGEAADDDDEDDDEHCAVSDGVPSMSAELPEDIQVGAAATPTKTVPASYCSCSCCLSM
jgi:hypothetical protein